MDVIGAAAVAILAVDVAGFAIFLGVWGWHRAHEHR